MAADEPLGPAGDRHVRFERLYAASYEAILGYALRRTKTPEDAADVLAETFLTAWRRMDQAPEGPTQRLWLYGIARRVLANHLRGQRRYSRLGARLLSTAERAVIQPFDPDPDPAGVIAAAFDRLGDTDREILALAGWELLRPGEIAQVLGCSGGSARVRLYRARQRFARELTAAGVQV